MFLDKKMALTKARLAIAAIFLNRDFIIVAISVGLLIVGASFLFKSANEWVNWKYDDAEHLTLRTICFTAAA